MDRGNIALRELLRHFLKDRRQRLSAVGRAGYLMPAGLQKLSQCVAIVRAIIAMRIRVMESG